MILEQPFSCQQAWYCSVPSCSLPYFGLRHLWFNFPSNTFHTRNLVKTFSLSPIHETFLWKTTLLSPKQSIANDEMRNLAVQIQSCMIPSCKIPAVCWQKRELLKLFLKPLKYLFHYCGPTSLFFYSPAPHWSGSLQFLLESCWVCVSLSHPPSHCTCPS